MDLLAAFLAGASILRGLIALCVSRVVASPAVSARRAAPQPARVPVRLIESDVRGGVRGIFP
jgi:hypothetical protein